MSWAPLVLSLKVATWAMVLALVLGVALAVVLDWPRLPARHFLDAIVSAPLVLPPTALGFYLLVVFGRDSALGRAWEWVFGSELVFTFSAAVIAAAVGSIPLVVRSVRVGLDAVDPDLISAARTLGARPARVLFTIVLPLATPALTAGAMLAFARALGDYGATMMFAGVNLEGTSTGSTFIMNELYRPGPDGEESARNMSLAMTIVGVGMLYVSNRLLDRLRPRRG
jgi:molybdate transport system permease protein